MQYFCNCSEYDAQSSTVLSKVQRLHELLPVQLSFTLVASVVSSHKESGKQFNTQQIFTQQEHETNLKELTLNRQEERVHSLKLTGACR